MVVIPSRCCLSGLLLLACVVPCISGNVALSRNDGSEPSQLYLRVDECELVTSELVLHSALSHDVAMSYNPPG